MHGPKGATWWWAMALTACAVGTAQAEVQPQHSPPTIRNPTETESPAPADKPNRTDSAPPDTAHRLRYTVGLKLKTHDVANASNTVALRPVLGLRYGRWRFGHATGDEWLQFSGYRQEANLAYQWRNEDRLNADLSLRVQNLQDNSSFDGFSSGKNTLRGRISVNYRLNQRWSIGTDLTQDLMGRGDGTTLSVGASYGLPLNERSALSFSGGLNWATADHWATQLRLVPPPESGWHAGIGSVGLGLSYRYAITPQWAWFGTLGTTRHMGQVQEVSPSALSWSGQIGVLYFSR